MERESKRTTKLIITDPHKFILNEGTFSSIPIHTLNFNTSILYNGIHCAGEISGCRSDSAKDSGGPESDVVSWVTLGCLKATAIFQSIRKYPFTQRYMPDDFDLYFTHYLL
jgi:hypothetical protein